MRNEYRFELLMDAGNGAQVAGALLIKEFAKQGKHVYIEPMIPAEISPPKRTPYSMSGVVIRISGNEIDSIGSASTLMLAEHEILLNRRLDDKEFSKDTIILLDTADEERNQDGYNAVRERCRNEGLIVRDFEINDVSKKLIIKLGRRGKNMFYAGILAAIMQADKDELASLIRENFKKLSDEAKDDNVDIFTYGFMVGKEQFSDLQIDVPSTPTTEEKIFWDGNTALSMGIIDAGIKLYAGYPITPASSIMHTLSNVFPKYGGIVHQAEDEISAIGAVIGSYYGGVPAITATSGPGLSLKQEFIGFSEASEIPLIVVNVQRGGPSTGMPTKTEQSDLFAALHGSHGDNTKIILSVSGVEDCFYAPHVARYLTEHLKVPVFIMSDYMTSSAFKVANPPTLQNMDAHTDLSDDVLAQFQIKPLPEVEMVKKNQSEPGTMDLMRRVTGLLTNENGSVDFTTESSLRAHDIRNKKLHALKQVLSIPEIIGDEGGDLLVVGWGSSEGAIREAVLACRQEGIKVSGLNFKTIYPLPLGLKDVFSKFKRIITAEVAHGDPYKAAPLAMLLRNETLVDVENGLTKASGRPLKPKSIAERIKELV